MLFKADDKPHAFTMHTVWEGTQTKIYLNVKFGSQVHSIKFSLPDKEVKPVRTYNYARKRASNLSYLSNTINATRLFGQPAEVRSSSWLNLEGVDKKTKEVYVKTGSGTVNIGTQTDDFTELFFDSSKLSGRWILRKIPNVFEKSYMHGNNCYLFWKPPEQTPHAAQKSINTSCPCPMKTLKDKERPKNLTKMSAKFQGDITILDESTFEGIAAAEGTWVDLYGHKFIYTSEFMDTLFQRMQSHLSRGGSITVDKEHDEVDNGFIVDVAMVQDPIKHIVVKGSYNGTLDDVEGLSPELMIQSAWNDEFLGWVPFDATPERVSLVTNPACKICWIQEK